MRPLEVWGEEQGVGQSREGQPAVPKEIEWEKTNLEDIG